MKHLALLFVAGLFAAGLASTGCAQENADTQPSQPTSKPAGIDLHKSGTYSQGKWKHEYTVSALGTRSERRQGILYHDGKKIGDESAKIMDRIQTPWGMMQYFGNVEQRYNLGWLLARTYDEPIDPKAGALLPARD